MSVLTSTPSFELEIPAGSTVCGVFQTERPGRSLRGEYESKSVARLAAGVVELSTVEDTFPGDLIEELRFGAPDEVAEAAGAGVFRVLRIAAGGEETQYRFNYEQRFVLPGGESLLGTLSGRKIFIPSACGGRGSCSRQPSALVSIPCSAMKASIMTWKALAPFR